MNVAEPFVRRPIATSLLALGLLLAGLVAFQFLPVAPLPRIDMPTIQVSANLPGASPETMSSSVATPLERRFGRIAGVTEITSSSAVGSTNITLQFDLDRDVESAARDVQAAIVAASGELPTSMPSRPTYRKVNQADAPILILALRSDTLPLAKVFDSANTVLAQKIAQVEGVGQVFVGGGQQPAVRIQADPQRLASQGLTLADVRQAVASATQATPKGALSDDQGTRRTIAANDQLFVASAYEDVIVSAKEGGAVVRLRDVANVFDDVENQRVAAWMDGKRTVLLMIRREPGANILETNARIKALLPELSKSISPAIQVDVAIDRTQSIRASVDEVEHTLVLSIALVVVVVLVFLRSARATLIPSVVVPLSLVGTFGVMHLLSYSLDNLSLMALTIATGFVVDDAIVVTENVARFIERGDTPFEAALKGAKQIGFTIVSITASLLAVFIPILLMGGVVGRLFREFAMTLSVAITVSAVLSLTLTPTMCARFLRAMPPSEGAPTTTRSSVVAKLGRLAERGFDGLLRGYGRSLRFVLGHRVVVLLVALGTVALTIGLAVVVPKGLFPQQDVGQLNGTTDAPQDVSFASMKERQERVNALMGTDPDVLHFVSFVGGGPGASTSSGTMFVGLRPKPARSAAADAIIGRLRPKLSKMEGTQVFLQSVQDVRIGGRAARTQYQFTLTSADLQDLRSVAPKLVERLKKIPELRDVNSDQQTASLELRLEMDRDSLARVGTTPQAVDDALYDAFGQRQIATFFTEQNPYRVVLEVMPPYAKGPEAIDGLYVKGQDGIVPLGALGKARIGTTPLSVSHQGQFPATTISFNLAPGVSLSQAMAAIDRASRDVDMPASVRGSFQGTAKEFTRSLESEPFLVGFALIAVYLVLGILYESAIHPITILSTLPSAGVGAFVALLVSKTEFTIIALVGIILLIGIVKKNAILMIDFAIEARAHEGLSAKDAIEKACLLRFRPILMTTLAALFGALPLAFGSGTGAELRRPLGITIVGGLLFSQVLTLYTTPVIYLALDRFSRRRAEGDQSADATRSSTPLGSSSMTS